MLVNRVEKHQIKRNHPMFKVCDEYCFKSKNIYNYANYNLRQNFIVNGKHKKYFEMCDFMKNTDPYKDIGANSGQQTLKILEQNWKSYFAAIKDWGKNPHKYLGKPRLPKYLDKEGRFVWVLTNVQSKIVDGKLVFSFKPIREFSGLIKTKVQGKHMQTRIVPNRDIFNLEIVYQIEIEESRTIICDRVLGIDLGLNNLITSQNNFNEKPFVINGRPLKSINKSYNMKTSRMQSILKKTNGKNWSKKLDSVLIKRNNKIDNYMHNTTKWIVDYCFAMKVNAVVVGKNKKWKQNNRMRNFIQIPFEKLIHQLQYKLEQAGIKVILTEESYTSKASFLDNDKLSKSKFSGERIQRGLYKSSNGTLINADVNGAGNIIRKVFPNAFDGIEGVGLHPVIINI